MSQCGCMLGKTRTVGKLPVIAWLACVWGGWHVSGVGGTGPKWIVHSWPIRPSWWVRALMWGGQPASGLSDQRQ